MIIINVEMIWFWFDTMAMENMEFIAFLKNNQTKRFIFRISQNKFKFIDKKKNTLLPIICLLDLNLTLSLNT